MRRSALLLTAAVLLGLAAPAAAQTDANSFSYAPDAQERGKAITISGRCADTEELAVSVQQGAAGDGSFVFSKTFPAETDARVSGSITVPDDAPFGPYVISAVCRTGSYQPFAANGSFSVVEKASSATTTPRSTTTTTPSTTSTTVGTPATVTTTTVTSLSGSVDEDPAQDATTTTLDEFAATRNKDDDSIGPLLLLVGLVPLALAVGAIALAMRRRPAPGGDV